MVIDILLLIVGMALLIKGADWFVGGSSAIAKAMRIPSLIIGLTLVSMGTSAPEASVSINSAVQGMNGMSLGNVVGSNIFNTLVIIGISALFMPLSISKDMRVYDIPIMVGLYVVLMLFAFVISPLKLDLFESIILLVLFVAYNAFLIIRAKKANKNSVNDSVGEIAVENSSVENSAAENSSVKNIEVENTGDGEAASVAVESASAATQKKDKPIWLSIILVVVGLAGIIFGGKLVVDNAHDIAIALGMSEVLVGLTIVAVGTSLPELVTSIVACVKKENDIAIGNVIGSNIFNIIFILGLSSTISSLTLDWASLVDMLVMFGSAVFMMLIAFFSKNTKRWQGVIFILMYIAYLAYIIIRN